MRKMNAIIDYLQRIYEPVSMILYGSYADGSNNENSDFDALIVSEHHKMHHDTSLIDGVQLDVFVYPVSYLEGEFDCSEFLQIFDGKILLDENGRGAALTQKVLSYIREYPTKSFDEISDEIEWCRKMLLRTKRNDAEGAFRWHWVLTDSLEIFCDVVHRIYLGPKKTLRWMKGNYPQAFEFYEKALLNFRQESLHEWILYLERLSISENT